LKKIIIFLGMIWILAACESPPVRRAELVAQHPEWSAETIRAINDGFILKGMSPDQVKAAWGRPCYTCTGTVKYQDSERWLAWEYQTQIVFFDKNERVERWSGK
jgi:hypothetical protein